VGGHRNGILSPFFSSRCCCRPLWRLQGILGSNISRKLATVLARSHGPVTAVLRAQRRTRDNTIQNKITARHIVPSNTGTSTLSWMVTLLGPLVTTGQQPDRRSLPSANTASGLAERSWATKTISTAKQKLAFSSLFPSSHSDQTLLMNNSFVPEMYVLSKIFPEMPSVGY
jgi:hypothetical protein